MKDSFAVMILLQVILIMLNAVFACAEIAVISMNESKLSKMVADGDKRAVKLARLTNKPAKFLATIQVAITLSGFLGSAFAADNFSDKLVNWVVNLGVPVSPSTIDTYAVILITIVLSYFTLVFGELVPKRIAMRKAEALALSMSSMLNGIAKLFAPVVWILTVSTNAVLRVLGIDPNQKDDEISEEEIRMMVDAGSKKGAIDIEENEFIQNVFEFDDLTARDIATHRTEITLLRLDDNMDEWRNTIYNSCHTLFPIYGKSVDNIVGILNAKDYFRLDNKSRENIIKNAVKPPYFVPDKVKADVLFRNMRETKNTLSVVLDEYGGMVGIVTITDLIEQLVGELNNDETQKSELSMIKKIDNNTWKVQGDTLISDIAKTLNVTLTYKEFDTLNGLVFKKLSTIPSDGSVFNIETDDMMIKITKIYNHQVESALISLKSKDFI